MVTIRYPFIHSCGTLAKSSKSTHFNLCQHTKKQDVKTTDSSERWHLKDCGKDEDHFMPHSPLSTPSSDTVTNRHTADADRT